MAASLSRPDPSSPASVAEAGFSTTRRGYQQDEVRAFLTSVAAELGRLQERQRQLEAELQAARSADTADVVLDDETVARVLGEETLRVLHTARESASEIKIRAEENAARILREANDEANRLRQEAEVEAARRRHDAASEAEGEVALAKQQGREMVNEARSYRERVLADLERRTTLARHQIEELIHGRDRLLQVFERARLVAVDVTSELQAIDGPGELVNLAPTTGPLPLMVPAARRGRATDDDDFDDDGLEATDVVADDASDEAATTDDTTATDDAADAADGATHDAGAGDDAEHVTGDEAEQADDGEEAEQGDAGDDAEQADAGVDDAGSGGGPTAAAHDANVVSLFRGRSHPGADDADDGSAGDDDDGERPDVGGLFARLRTEIPPAAADDVDDTDAADAEPDAEPDVVAGEETPFTRRDEALVPLIVSGARKLKRVLADEQNGVLDTLRRAEPVTTLDDLLPSLDEHLGVYVEALADELIGAAAAGATEAGVNDTKTLRRKLPKAGALEGSHALVRSDLVAPLRDRLARSVADGAGDNEDVTRRVRSVYREWKTQHIDDQLDDIFRFAHGGGTAVIVEPGTPMVWTIDPSEPSCPDCEDNSLAGEVAAGEPYPTGHSSAPAHPGCRCLTVPASQ